MTTMPSVSRPRRIIARLGYITAVLGLLAFIFFITTDFSGNAWAACGFLSLASVILSNTITHPRGSQIPTS